MGCDIHLHTEIKVRGVWHHYSHPRINRNYRLFSKMAGVRAHEDDDPPIAQPRGLPEGLSFTTQFDADRWGIDGHSHSWLSATELAGLVEWMDSQHKDGNKWWSWEWEELGYLFGNGWNVHAYPTDYPDGLEDARVIFWFDN